MITNGQKTVAGTALSVLVLPAGAWNVALANAGTAATAFVGMGTGVTSTTGFPLPSGLVSPVVFQGYPGGPSGTLFAISGAGTANVAWILSTAVGGTGL